MYVQRVRLKMLEPLFFSTREIGKIQETEPVVGNYALAYAMGLVSSMYNSNHPTYKEDFAKVKERVYITPAVFTSFATKTETFNTGSESYWYEFGKNVVHHSPFSKAKGRNFPQNGQIKFILTESMAIFYIISNEKMKFPNYIRLGKFMSKAKLIFQNVKVEKRYSNNTVKISVPLNPLDLSPKIEFFSYELLMMRPTPLLMNSILKGEYYEIVFTSESGRIEREYIPCEMKFFGGVENDTPST